LRTGVDRRQIAGRVDVAQCGLADGGVTLVLAVVGSPVTEEMLHRCHHVVVIKEIGRADLALQAFDEWPRIARHQRRVLGVTFIGTTPTVILRNRHGRRERPFHAGHAGFGSGDPCDLPQQFRVARRAQADVVRKQGGANHVALAMHRVDAPYDRDGLATSARVHRGFPERVSQRQPLGGLGVVATARVGRATSKD